jgi:hypothetical protein
MILVLLKSLAVAAHALALTGLLLIVITLVVVLLLVLPSLRLVLFSEASVKVLVYSTTLSRSRDLAGCWL